MVRTPDGEALFQRIKASFDDIAQAVDTVLPEGCRTRLTVFATTFIANYLIQQIPKFLRNDYPDVNLIFCKAGYPPKHLFGSERRGAVL